MAERGGRTGGSDLGRRGFLGLAGAFAAAPRAIFASKQGKLACAGGPQAVPPGLEKGWPLITDDERKAVLRVLDRGAIWGEGAPETRGLEEEWARFIGVRHAIATGSGTSAIHMAVAAAGLGPGDECLVPAYTWYATASPVIHHNAVPVFVDIDPRTFNMDPRRVEERITPRTKAIIPVDLFGLPADIDEIRAIAAKRNLIVIEDACQAHGALYKGKRAGSLCHIGAFSLNGTKNLPAGEGGIFTTDDDRFAEIARSLRQFGPFGGGELSEFGWQYRPQEMPSAFARARIPRLDAENAVRQRNAEILGARLREIPGVIPPHVPPDRTHVYHMYRIRLDPGAAGVELAPRMFRTKVQKALAAEGVPLGSWVGVPLPAFRMFQLRRGYGKGCPWSCPHAPSEATYRSEDYPGTLRIIDDSFVMTSALYPPNGEALMRAYADAFEKVFSNLDAVLRIES